MITDMYLWLEELWRLITETFDFVILGTEGLP